MDSLHEKLEMLRGEQIRGNFLLYGQTTFSLDEPGHYLFDETGRSVSRREDRGTFPWNEWSSEEGVGIDCQLQPGCYKQDGYWRHGQQRQCEALLHHKDGWTALCFWDRSVDRRSGCNSNYFAEGIFTFEEMVAMAKDRFAERWKKHGDVRLAHSVDA